MAVGTKIPDVLMKQNLTVISHSRFCEQNVAQKFFVFLQIILGNLLGTLPSVLEILFGGSCAFQIQHVHYQRIWLLEFH
jgi:hypothetical protein